MRACARCSYENPTSLAYCFQCGRRLGRSTGGPGSGNAQPSGLNLGGSNGPATATGTATGVTTGFAATVALSLAARQRQQGLPGGETVPRRPMRVLAAAWHALVYLFAYVRGRIHAEDRKRSLAEERRGAQRLIDAALAELGAAAIGGTAPPAELTEAARTVSTARQRREAATADLTNAERLQAATDLRLGLDQAAAESEWKACARGVEELDRMLRELDEERRLLEAAGERVPMGVEAAALAGDMRATQQKRAQLADQVSTLRERAAALRASTTAARTKLDQATAARRTSAAALAAGLAAQTRARTEADRTLSQAIVDAGRRALELRLPVPELLPRYERIDRLSQTIADSERAVGNLNRHLGGYDNRKLATGAVILTGLLIAAASFVWALAR